VKLFPPLDLSAIYVGSSGINTGIQTDKSHHVNWPNNISSFEQNVNFSNTYVYSHHKIDTFDQFVNTPNEYQKYNIMMLMFTISIAQISI